MCTLILILLFVILYYIECRLQNGIQNLWNSRVLSKYEASINEASFKLCLLNPDLLNDRTRLLSECRKKVDDDGYIYKKGRLCSKSLHPSESAKRPNQIKNFRIRRDIEVVKYAQ